jgi:WD40 repeat protein
MRAGLLIRAFSQPLQGIRRFVILLSFSSLSSYPVPTLTSLHPQVKIWTPSLSPSTNETTFSCSATLKFSEAATAVAATQLPSTGEHVLAVGLENGEIRVFVGGGGEWEEKRVLDQSFVSFLSFLSSVFFPSSETALTFSSLLANSIAHVLTVSTLAFSPISAPAAGERTVRLASGSEDHSVRVFDIEL